MNGEPEQILIARVNESDHPERIEQWRAWIESQSTVIRDATYSATRISPRLHFRRNPDSVDLQIATHHRSIQEIQTDNPERTKESHLTPLQIGDTSIEAVRQPANHVDFPASPNLSARTLLFRIRAIDLVEYARRCRLNRRLGLGFLDNRRIPICIDDEYDIPQIIDAGREIHG